MAGVEGAIEGLGRGVATTKGGGVGVGLAVGAVEMIEGLALARATEGARLGTGPVELTNLIAA